MASPAPKSVTRPPFPPVVAQVISGWLAAESAFSNAAHTPDPDAPELGCHHDRSAVDLVPFPNGADGGARSDSRGPSPRPATPLCHWHCTGTKPLFGRARGFGRWMNFAASGRPAPGVLGQVDYELFTSTMQQTERRMEAADTSGGCGSMRSTSKLRPSSHLHPSSPASHSVTSAQASAFGGDGPGGHRSRWSLERWFRSGGPGGGASGQGGGQSPSPWLCTYTELILNDGEGIAPGGSHSREAGTR